MFTHKRTTVALATMLVIGFLIGIGSTVYADRHSETDLTRILPVYEIRQLAQVIDRIQRAYVDEISADEIIQNAINGILSGLDPHSSFLTAEDFADLRRSTSGQFGGLGIEVQMEDGMVNVVSPIDDTPAYRAGVQAGDRISHLNGEPVQGMNLTQAVEIMRGEPGTTIDLTIVRGTETFDLTIERAIIQVTSVRSRLLKPGFGMVRISAFQQNSGRDLVNEINKLRDENGGDLRGLVLDLRNNPGGLLNASVDVVDVFLGNELVVYTESRLPESAQRYHARAQTPYADLPLVVLINGGSASASEIVAGALQDHGRAVIMGVQSFGKGSVQTILPLENESALKLTTARYYSPSGRSIQAAGITPDIEVQQGQFVADETAERRERDLQGHLDESQNTADGEADQAAEPPLRERDFQLHEALQLLRGLAILNRL